MEETDKTTNNTTELSKEETLENIDRVSEKYSGNDGAINSLC